MPTKKSTEEQKKTKVSYVGTPAEENPLIYVNNVEMSVSLFDVQIRLNRIAKIEDGEIFLKNQGTVAMSPQHALSLLALLQRTLANYAADHGPIPSSPALSVEEQ